MRVPAAALSRILAAALLAPLVSAGCASASGPPLAQDEGSDYSREGAYIGLYGIKAYENFDTSGSGVTAGDSDLGAGVRLGYRASPTLAVEVIAESVKGFALSTGTVKSDMDLLNFGAMGKFYIGQGRLQPYLLGGLGVARADVRDFNFDDSGWFLRGGLGLDVYLTSNFAVFGEANYNRMMGGVSDLHHIDLMAGIQFRF